MPLAVAVFACALALIATDKLDRVKVALIGASAVVVLGVIDQHAAIEAVEFEALGLLAGMMIAVRITETTGVYSYIAIRAGQISRGRPFLLVAIVSIATGILSAFLDNLTTILLMVPIAFLLADVFDFDPIPLVLIQVIASNVGGTATLIGDPPNIMIGAATGLSFNAFIANLAPIVVPTLIVVTGLMYLMRRRKLWIDPSVRGRVMQLDPSGALEDREELGRVGPVLIGILVVFFIHKPIGIEPATVALAGASVMLAVSRQSLDEVLRGIDWPTLFFFLGLFVMVGGLEETGALDQVAEGIVAVTDGDRTAELLTISWVAAIGGGMVDNIPLTAAMIPVVDQIAPGGDDAYWWALALGACFGGNLTLIAAAANVAAAGMAARSGRPIGFVEFLRLGVPATLVSMALVTVYILLRYA